MEIRPDQYRREEGLSISLPHRIEFRANQKVLAEEEITTVTLNRQN